MVNGDKKNERMDGLHMTKGFIGMSQHVNKYTCLATGVNIASKCAYRLHKKKCQMCATTPLPQSELLGKSYTTVERKNDPKYSQKGLYVARSWK